MKATPSSTSSSRAPSELGRFLKRGSLFCTGLAVLFAGLNAAVGSCFEDLYQLQYRTLDDPALGASLVIVGGSHATNGVDPAGLESLGHSVLNLAAPGSNPRYTAEWYRRSFRPRHDDTQVILYEVNWFMFDPRVMWRRYEHDSQYVSFREFLAGFLVSDVDRREWLYNRFPLVKSRRKLQRVALGQAYDPFPCLWTEFDRGYLPISSGGYSINRLAVAEPSNLAEQVDAFVALIARLKRRHRVIFIQAPEFRGAPERGDASRGNALLELIAEKTRTPFLNYNVERVSQLNFDQTKFADWGHLNQQGSRAFTAVLARDLAKVLATPPR